MDLKWNEGLWERRNERELKYKRKIDGNKNEKE